MNDNHKDPQDENSKHQDTENTVDGDRRKAVGKLAYASPLLVAALFSKNSAAIGDPPPVPTR